MRGKKPNPNRTKRTYQRKDEGALVPDIQAIVQTDQERGAPIPSIQAVVQPSEDAQTGAETQTTPDARPSEDAQTSTGTQTDATPKPTETASSK